jgi:hypothetical protein
MEEAEEGRTCLYCGTTIPAEGSACSTCREPLIPLEEMLNAQDEVAAVANAPDMRGLELEFEEEEGLSHPKWEAVREQLAIRPKSDWWDAYHELAKQWLIKLKTDLGGNYHVYESDNFLVLSAEGPTATRKMMSYGERFLGRIQHYCEGIPLEETYGKRVMLIFTDQDDYYAYVSHFHVEGTHSLSWGMMLSRGYMHIALPFTWILSAQRVIAHELVHNYIAHLGIPSWVHEGMAQKLERLALSTRGFTLDHELATEHRAHWTEENIQEFWSGASFYVGDERNKLSYSLAEILTELLSTDWKVFIEFVSEADYRDAGQDASLRILNRCLGETIGQFLGAGNCRPQRKIIAEHIRARIRKSEPKAGRELTAIL